ncbi:uncharacterized protein LOC107368867 [Tetranychus urticae]|uniref:MD-2-related lipid-recognition domain-containing protein n=1 Tax=Tetranychus urticae TaxID=32264 RepID=T1KZM5_TETUR|nr:uncharacterized protein LOC107368867 [Tetranychus urticae]XP_025017985.1 uncharacterized protein LOC107368867 [Tetranychus urticae]
MNFLLIVACFSLSSAAYGLEPPRKPCEKVEQHSDLVSVVSYNNANATSWQATPGKAMKVDFIFTAKENIGKIEQAIYAILDPKGGPGGKPLEVSYDKAEDACKFINSTSCVTEGIKKNKPYKMSLSFDVPVSVPKIALEVRFVVRESVNSKRLNRLQRMNWLKHPGKILLCYRLPVQVI